MKTLCLLLLIITANMVYARIWTSTSGTQIEAELVDLKNDTVYLKLPDESVTSFPIRIFVRSDQEIVHNQIQAHRNEQKVRNTKKVSAECLTGGNPHAPNSNRVREFLLFLNAHHASLPSPATLSLSEQSELSYYQSGRMPIGNMDEYEARVCLQNGIQDKTPEQVRQQRVPSLDDSVDAWEKLERQRLRSEMEAMETEQIRLKGQIEDMRFHQRNSNEGW